MRPLLPFPLPLNIGTDICHIRRIYRIVSSPRAARFVDRILTREEQAREGSRLRVLHLWRHGGEKREKREGGERDTEVWEAAAFLAGRFAAKEAAIKAHLHRRLTFHNIVIEPRTLAVDTLGSGPKIARILREQEDSDASAMISISHDGEYATATCMAYDPSVEVAGPKTNA